MTGHTPPASWRHVRPASMATVTVLLLSFTTGAATVGSATALAATPEAPAVTLEVFDLRAGPEHSNPRSLVASGGNLWFTAATDGCPGHARELWVADPDPREVVDLNDATSGNCDGATGDVASLGSAGVLFSGRENPFTHGDVGVEPYTSDATEEGTTLLLDLNRGDSSSSPELSTVLGGSHVAMVGTRGGGTTTWLTDGTAEGTVSLGAIDGTEHTDFGPGAVAGSGFAWMAEGPGLGEELFASDGTPDSARLVADIAPGGDGSSPRHLTTTSFGLVFSANDGEHGEEPWASDGSEAGTRRLADVAPGLVSSTPALFTAVGDRAFFSASNHLAGTELWVTEGTAETTRLVADLRPGSAGAGPYTAPIAFDDRLFFAANDGVHGAELWTSDGTAEGTSLFADLSTTGASDPRDLTRLGDWLLFRTTADGGRLWLSDGTVEGTHAVADAFAPGRSFDGFVVVDDRTAWFRTTTAAGGHELGRLQLPDPREPVPLTVTITEVEALGPGLDDASSPPDLYARVSFRGSDGIIQTNQSEPVADLSRSRPYWTFGFATRPDPVVVSIEVLDHEADDPDAPRQADVNPDPADSTIILEVDPVTGTWSGGPSTGQGCFRGDDASLAAAFCVTVGNRHPGGDGDGDGLLDTWELRGYDPDGDGVVDVDLRSLGAEVCRRDILVEVDWMTGRRLDEGVLNDARAMFAGGAVDASPTCFVPGEPVAAAGINLIVDEDEELDHQRVVTCDDLLKLRDSRQAASLAPISHYGLIGDRHTYSGNTSGGIACDDGVFAVTLGGWSFGSFQPDAATARRRIQGGVLLHELGHTLGLRHGGGDEGNHKPNYLSVMNYSFSITGLPLAEDPTQVVFDFSRSVLPVLDETTLDETSPLDATSPYLTTWRFSAFAADDRGAGLALGPVAQPIDWNRDGGLDEKVVHDLALEGRRCVDPGDDGIAQTAAAGDDDLLLNHIFPGRNGLCETVPAAGSDDEMGNAGLRSHVGFDDWANLRHRGAQRPVDGRIYGEVPGAPGVEYDEALAMMRAWEAVAYPDAPDASPSPAPTAEPASPPAASPTPTASPQPTPTPTPDVTPTAPPVTSAPPASQDGPATEADVEEPAGGFVSRALDGVVRLAGPDRFATAVAVSRQFFDGPIDEVVVATGQDHPDALAGAALAAARRVPMLLVAGDRIPDVVVAELRRLRPAKITVLGGSSAVGDAVADELRSLARDGVVDRLHGPDRWQTAAAVAAAHPGRGRTAYVVNGVGFADAVTVGPLASDGPVLLVANDHVPEPTWQALEDLRPDRIVVVGGPTAVGQAVVTRLAQFDAEIVRLAGADRHATSARVAAEFTSPTDLVFVASARDFPDALAAGAVGNLGQAPLLLVPERGLPPAIVAALERLSPRTIVVLGGAAAISEETAGRLQGHLR